MTRLEQDVERPLAPRHDRVVGRAIAEARLAGEVLEEGYRYDSSLFPIRRPGYGYAGGGRDPHWLPRPAGRLLEVPPATVRWLGLNLPAAGGAYFRLLPPVLVHAALRAAERRGQPGTFYLHPWEYDPAQPRIAVPLLTRIRHYGGLGGTWGRLERLLTEFRFGSIAQGLGAMEAALAGGPCGSHLAS